MKVCAVALAAVLVAVARADAEAVNPIEKVMQLIAGLQAKCIKEGESAQKVYEEYAEWCEDRAKDTHTEIKDGKAEAADLKAGIEKAGDDGDAASTKIEELSSAIATSEEDLKAAEGVRAKENADYVVNEKELLDTVDMIQRAVAIVQKESQGGASLMQVKSAGSLSQAFSAMVAASAISVEDSAKLTALVQSDSDSEDGDEDMDEELGAPDPDAYSKKTGTIIDTLQSLLEKADGTLAETRKAEMTSKHNFELLKQSLDDKVRFGNKDMAEAKKAKAEAGEAKATGEGALTVTQKDLQENAKALEELHHDCMTKASDFEEETKSRGEEINALATAKKVIAESTGDAEKKAYGEEGASFVQVKMRSKATMKMKSGTKIRSAMKMRSEPPEVKVVHLVRRLGWEHKSTALVQLASRIDAVLHLASTSGADPFSKVKGLINDMLQKLMKEAGDEAAHKAWCDQAMSETKEKKDDKESDVEKQTTKIDSMTAASAKLVEEVAALQNEVAKLVKSQGTMDRLRQQENAVYRQEKPDMEQGLDGIKKALKVLREYYAKGDSTSGGGAGSGIIGLLEVVESDFSKQLAEIIAVEEAAQRSYEEETQESAVERAAKDQDIKYKTKEVKSLDKTVAEVSSDRDGVSSELEAVNEYFDKVKAGCIAKAEPYAERKKRREQELAGLRDALEVLDGGGASLLQEGASRRTLRGAQSYVN